MMQITVNPKYFSIRAPIAFAIVAALFSTSCRNMFTELADKESNAAIFYDAQRLADDRDWTGAISKVAELDSTYRNRRDVQIFLASAYLGRCGLDYILLANKLINDTTGSSPMELALEHMKSATIETDCKQAETILRTVSPAGDGIMSDDVNDAFLMAFVSLGKMGAMLARLGDSDDNGVIDAAYDACNMSTADAREMGAALTLLYNNISSSGSDIATEMGALTTACTANAAAATFCAKTDPAAFDPAAVPESEIRIIRGVVNYAQVGVGGDASLTPCGL